MTIVITNCTNRKRKPVTSGLNAASLAIGDLAAVAQEWAGRLRAPAPYFPVLDLYGGRSFQEAKASAAGLRANMFVISAGLGLIDATGEIPSYACTVASGAIDGIEPRVLGNFSSAEWWAHLNQISPFTSSLASVFSGINSELCLAAISDTYIRMLSPDLLALADNHLAKLRLFTRAPLEGIPERLRPYVMPYDDRLDGPESLVRGTRSDFAGRALRHFSDYVLPGTEDFSAQEHRKSVELAMAGWSFPVSVERGRLSDDQILGLLNKHWEETRGSTSVLLRLFRDTLKVACEQSRFATLARRVRMERANG